MRPLLPQPTYSLRLLLRCVVIYGIIALIVLLFLVLMDFLIPKLEYYLDYYKFYGKSGTIRSFREDFWGMDSEFMSVIDDLPVLSILAPLGAGGILGVLHYVFVRKRRSNLPS